mgnify:CR=1 FL=1
MCDENPLKRWRKGHNLTRAQLAALLDVATETLAAVERGYRRGDRVIERLTAAGFVGRAEAENLREQLSRWRQRQRARLRKEVWERCGQQTI